MKLPWHAKQQLPSRHGSRAHSPGCRRSTPCSGSRSCSGRPRGCWPRQYRSASAHTCVLRDVMICTCAEGATSSSMWAHGAPGELGADCEGGLAPVLRDSRASAGGRDGRHPCPDRRQSSARCTRQGTASRAHVEGVAGGGVRALGDHVEGDKVQGDALVHGQQDQVGGRRQVVLGGHPGVLAHPEGHARAAHDGVLIPRLHANRGCGRWLWGLAQASSALPSAPPGSLSGCAASTAS